MADGNYKIGLNEVAVGLILPGAIGEIYQYILGKRNAEIFSLTGKLLNPNKALEVGLIDEIQPLKKVLKTTKLRMLEWFQLPSFQQSQTKLKLRESLIKKIKENQKQFTEEIIDIWFSKEGQNIIGELVNRLKN